MLRAPSPIPTPSPRDPICSIVITAWRDVRDIKPENILFDDDGVLKVRASHRCRLSASGLSASSALFADGTRVHESQLGRCTAAIKKGKLAGAHTPANHPSALASWRTLGSRSTPTTSPPSRAPARWWVAGQDGRWRQCPVAAHAAPLGPHCVGQLPEAAPIQVVASACVLSCQPPIMPSFARICACTPPLPAALHGARGACVPPKGRPQREQG